MTTRTVTVAQLIADYAEPIAGSAGFDPSEYDQDAAGLATLLHDVAEDFSPTDQTRQWLVDAATGLYAIAQLGDDGPKTQELLTRIDSMLYDAKADLA